MILGIIGGVLGLVMTPLYLLLTVVVLAVAALAQAGQLLILIIVFLTAPLGAVLGIIGGILSRRRPRLGGVIMLIGGAFPLVLVTVSSAALAAAASKSSSLPSGITTLYALYFWTFILLVGGIISFAAKPPAKPTPTSLST